MAKFKIMQNLVAGQYTYREGEVFTDEELDYRQFPKKTFDIHVLRSEIVELPDVEQYIAPEPQPEAPEPEHQDEPQG